MVRLSRAEREGDLEIVLGRRGSFDEHLPHLALHAGDVREQAPDRR